MGLQPFISATPTWNKGPASAAQHVPAVRAKMSSKKPASLSKAMEVTAFGRPCPMMTRAEQFLGHVLRLVQLCCAISGFQTLGAGRSGCRCAKGCLTTAGFPCACLSHVQPGRGVQISCMQKPSLQCLKCQHDHGIALIFASDAVMCKG